MTKVFRSLVSGLIYRVVSHFPYDFFFGEGPIKRKCIRKIFQCSRHATSSTRINSYVRTVLLLLSCYCTAAASAATLISLLLLLMMMFECHAGAASYNTKFVELTADVLKISSLTYR